jgi:hypothetical protein
MAIDQQTNKPNRVAVIASATVAWAYVLAVGVTLFIA